MAVGTNGKPMAYTPKKTVGYEQTVAVFAQNAMSNARLQPFLCPVELELVFTLPIPLSWSGKRTQAAINGQIAHTKKPDLDNLEKSVKDGLNGVAWNDDRQVISCSKRKRYGPVLGVSIRVIPLDLDSAP
jgi:Holliday junction resolvase RusA-like endonuclease